MQDRITKSLGLVTQFNPLTIAPGAQKRSDNAVHRRENVIEPRRGHKLYSAFASAPKKLMSYMSKVLVHQGSTVSYDDGTGTFSDYSGTYAAPTGTRMRSVEAFSNLYVTTSLGAKVFSNVTGTAARLSGAPRALDPSYTLTGAAGFLSNGNQCAYRSVLRRTDAQSNTITGYPSQRLWVTNSAGGARNVILTEYLPSEAIAGDVIQFYRTEQVVGTTDDISADEMGLVYQYELVSADISAGFITFTDSVTDSLRGATLYISPSQEGIQQANDRPPLAKDLCLYKSNYMLYANTQTKQRLNFAMVGAGSLSGKTITLGGVTYNFGASEIISGAGSPQAIVSATGVAAVDIDLTARSLVRVINRYASNTTVYAYYLSGPDDLPGQIMIEEKGVGASAFTLQASDTAISAMFFPAPPVSPSTNTKSTSSNSVQKNAVYYSKSQQPEHVPPLNYLLVGPANKEILRIVNLKDSAIVIKEEGVYRITGETPSSFTVVPVDLTVYCRAPESVCALANQVYMLSNQGVVAISESGVQVISHEIEPNLTPLLTNTSIDDYTFGCAYESERCYLISTLTNSSDSVNNQTLVYNTATQVWDRHTYAFEAAIVEPSTDKLFFSKPSLLNVYTERKDFADTDYADPESNITITLINGTTVEFTISAVTPAAGWVIAQGTTEIAISTVVAIAGGFRAIVKETPPSTWATGAAVIYPNVGFDIEWHAWCGPGPDVLKQVSGVAFLTDDTDGASSVSSFTGKFASNFDQEIEEVPITQPGTGWGGAWGSSPWGGSGDAFGYPTYVPRNKQFCSRLFVGLRHDNAREKISITGVAFVFNADSERIGR
jgi:hypothetical protein